VRGRNCFSIAGRGLRCFLSQNIKTGSVANQVPYSPGSGGSLVRVKRPEHKADHSSPSLAEAKNGWSYTSIPHVPARVHNVHFIFPCFRVTLSLRLGMSIFTLLTPLHPNTCLPLCCRLQVTRLRTLIAYVSNGA
jgi:hypothetical protein